MGLRINQNIAAMNSYRNLNVTDGQMSKSLEKLSSGFRINRAADDAAGLAISEKLRAQVTGLNKASENAQNGISLLQTAEGALNETHSVLQRIRELSVQAASDTNTDADRLQIQKEVTALVDEVGRIAAKTDYNGQKLLDGTFASKNLQIGANSGDGLQVTIGNMDVATLGLSGTAKGAAANGAVGTVGGTVPNGSFTIASDGATGTTSYVKDSGGNVVGSYDSAVGAGGTVTFAAGNGTGARTVAFDKSILTNTTVGAEAGTFTVSSAVSVSTQADANTAIATLDTAIGKVSTERANLGATQNRLEHTVNNLGVAAENLAASESRIRDADMAKEMMAFTRSQILSQAGTAMLAQANQSSQGVLSLLR